MRWNPLNSNDQIQDVYFYFYVWRKFKFKFQIHVPTRNIIGHFGPIPLNKWYSSNSKMHNSFMQNPIEVKFVTKLNRFERATTFIKERFSFEVHRKSYSRWKKWTFDLGLRKFSNMFDFPNFQLKIHHDTSFKWKSVQHESCFPWPHHSKTSKITSFGQSNIGLEHGCKLKDHLDVFHFHFSYTIAWPSNLNSAWCTLIFGSEHIISWA